MTPDNTTWYSKVEPVQTVKSADALTWDETADIVIVGLGGAGVACALQALELGKSVIAIDRFSGGGATEQSGGVIYAGGGTSIQKEAGVEDSPENMFNYLKMETGNIVSDKTLKRFCDESAPTIEWMRGHGVDLRPTLWPYKTSYPAPEYFLYHSDNSLVSPYKDKARPAARGHRGYVPVEQGRKATNLGGSLFHPLRTAAEDKGLRTLTYSEARQLIVDESGQVLGVKILQFTNDNTRDTYLRLRAKAKKLFAMFPPIIPGSKYFFKKAMAKLAEAERLEDQRESRLIRAQDAVVLSAGGFIFNSQMVKTYAPKYTRGYPLGTDGDNGAGIRLGQSAGGKIGNMDRITAWRFINPPLSFARGIIVDESGKRFINEMVYGATLGVEMVENHEGKAWMILDKALTKQALDDVSGKKALGFQKALAKLNIYFGSKKANSLSELSEKIGIDSDALAREVETYNQAATGAHKDPFEKTKDDVRPIDSPPFRAINIGLNAKLFPCPTLTLGGLLIDENTGQVLGEQTSKPIPGLYAAGRNAVGVCSHNYVSGLSIADGIYSGRRAARAIAQSGKSV